MKLYVYADYEATYSLNKLCQRNISNYGQVELTEDEYFAFEKVEIQFYEWQNKISKLIKDK